MKRLSSLGLAWYHCHINIYTDHAINPKLQINGGSKHMELLFHLPWRCFNSLLFAILSNSYLYHALICSKSKECKILEMIKALLDWVGSKLSLDGDGKLNFVSLDWGFGVRVWGVSVVFWMQTWGPGGEGGGIYMYSLILLGHISIDI